MLSPIKFRCPSCKSRLGVPSPEQIGKLVRCPACKQVCTAVAEKPTTPIPEARPPAEKVQAPPPRPEAPKPMPSRSERPEIVAPPTMPMDDEISAAEEPDEALEEVPAAPAKPARGDRTAAKASPLPAPGKKGKGGIDAATLTCVIVAATVVVAAGLIRYSGLVEGPPQVKMAQGPIRPKPPDDDGKPPIVILPDEKKSDPIPPRVETLETLIARLEKRDADERSEAARALGEKGAAAHPAVPKLEALLRDTSAEVREEAAKAIVAIGRPRSSVLVDFTATWCGPCRQMKPIVTRLQQEGLPVVVVDTDEHPELSSHFGVRSIPTFAVIQDGKAVKRTVGMTSEEYLREMLKDVGKTDDLRGELSLDGTTPRGRALALILSLSGEDQWLRFLAEEAFKGKGADVELMLVYHGGGNSPERLRLGALKAIPLALKGHSVSPRVKILLREQLQRTKESADVRGVAALALDELKIADSQIVPTLREALEKGSRPEVRALAATKLGALKVAEAVPALIERLGDESVIAREAAARALGTMGAKSAQAVPALIAAYEKDIDAEIRDDLKKALEQIVPAAGEALPAVVKALQSKEEAARLLALELLNSVDDPQAAAASLRTLLEDGNAGVRIQAAVALQRMGQDDEKVLQALVSSLKEQRENYEASEALMIAGKKATPLLVKSLLDPESTPQQRLRVTRLLAGRERASKATVTALTEALASKEPEIPTFAALALARVKADNPALVGPLTAGLKSKDKELRRECAQALGMTRSAAAVPALMAAVKEDKELRDQAAYALSALPRDEKTVAELNGLLKVSETRNAAARALANLEKHQETAAAALVEALAASEEEEERDALGQTLQSLGKPADALLLKLFEDKDKKEEVRLVALSILGQMGEEEEGAAPPGLEKYLKDPSKRIQTGVAIALARLRTDADVVGILLEAIQNGDEDSPQRFEAQSALSALGPKAAGSVDRLVEWLKGTDANRRNLAINTLPRVGRDSDKARSALVGLLKSTEDQNVRRSATYALNGFGEKAAGDLIKLLNDPAYSRPDVIAALQFLGPRAKGAGEHLTPLLKDKDRSVAVAAAIALATLDPKQEAAVPVLLEGLQSEDRGLRDQSLNALGTFGPRARSAVPELVRALEDREKRYGALNALTRIGPDAAEALDPLIKLLNSRERDFAARALGAIGPAAAPAVPRLLRMLKQDSTMQVAAEALGRIGGDAKLAVPILAARLSEEESVGSVCWALSHVGKFDVDQALPALRKVAGSKDAETRATTIRTLGQLKSAKVVKDLLEATKDSDLSVRVAAVGALGQLSPDAAEAVSVLTETLQAKEPALREAAAGALGNLGAAAKPAVPELIKALDNKETRYIAAHALGRIGASAEAAVPRLIELLDDSEARFSAAYALGQLGPVAKAAVPKLKKLVTDRDPHFAKAVADAIARIEGKDVPPSDCPDPE